MGISLEYKLKTLDANVQLAPVNPAGRQKGFYVVGIYTTRYQSHPLETNEQNRIRAIGSMTLPCLLLPMLRNGNCT